jgi:hypothetical protein
MTESKRAPPSDQDVAALAHLLGITGPAARALFANPEELAKLQLTKTMKARVAYRIKNCRDSQRWAVSGTVRADLSRHENRPKRQHPHYRDGRKSDRQWSQVAIVDHALVVQSRTLKISRHHRNSKPAAASASPVAVHQLRPLDHNSL